METITNKIIGYLDSDENIWDDVDRARMALGLQVLIHNFIMISVILIIAQMVGIPGEAVILLVAYGLLKITAGGIHFKKSATCLLGTGVFVIAGVLASRQLNISLSYMIFIYLICMFIFAIVGPQGTKNNPVSVENYKRLKKITVYIVFSYLLITIFMTVYFACKPYLLFVAVVFETVSVLPPYVKKRMQLHR